MRDLTTEKCTREQIIFQDTHGDTLAHIAIKDGSSPALQACLSKLVKDDFEIQNHDGQTILDLAEERYPDNGGVNFVLGAIKAARLNAPENPREAVGSERFTDIIKSRRSSNRGHDAVEHERRSHVDRFRSNIREGGRYV